MNITSSGLGEQLQIGVGIDYVINENLNIGLGLTGYISPQGTLLYTYNNKTYKEYYTFADVDTGFTIKYKF